MARAAGNVIRQRILAVALVAMVAGCATSAGTPSATAVAGSVSPSLGPSALPSADLTPIPSSIPSAAASTGASAVDAGTWIAYQLWDGRADIRLVRPDGTGDHALLVTPPGEEFHPDWSPDGRWLTFEMDGEIWIADVDGSHARAIATCRAPCRDLNLPAWSPDGKEIAFTRIDLVDGQNPGSVVQAVDVDGGAIRDLLHTEGAEYANGARWAPDGTSMVVQLDRFLDTGNDTSRVTGTAIGVFRLGDPSTKPRLLTKPTMFATYPDWRSDGSSIVFSTYDLGTRDGGGFADTSPPSDLYTIRPDGSGLKQLTHNPSGKTLTRNATGSGPLSSQPTWSPDGSSVIFVQTDGDTWPGWGMATIAGGGGAIGPAIGTTFKRGTHPRLRPTP